MPVSGSANVTLSPSEWDRMAEDADALDGGAWGSWHRAMGALQAAVDATLIDAEEGLWPVEQVDRLEARLTDALAALRLAAVAGEEAMTL